MRKLSPKIIWHLISETGNQFMLNKSFRLAAALAYNTIFSLPPLLFLILVVAGKVLGEEALTGELYAQTKGALGSEAAAQIQDMINKLNQREQHGIASV